MNREDYRIQDAEAIETPALVYYRDIIEDNTRLVISIAGGPGRLWPHVKTHKTRELVRMQMDMGIRRFKCATIAEAEMLASTGVRDVLVAYPLVGPAIDRFINLQRLYPQTVCWAIADDLDQLSLLSEAAVCAKSCIPLLIDVNYGMNRTGIALGPDADRLFRRGSALSGVTVRGFHCYDGNHNDKDLVVRGERVSRADEAMFAIAEKLVADAYPEPLFVMGGTPSFPCHAKFKQVFLSPGTAFVTDYGYYTNLPDLPFKPGAALLTRVVSHPAPRIFTLDLGYKGIAADPAGVRGVIVGLPDTQAQFQSEEHWVFKVNEDTAVPPIGSVQIVVPTHICPTSALYSHILVAQDHTIIDKWEVAARNRKLTV